MKQGTRVARWLLGIVVVLLLTGCGEVDDVEVPPPIERDFADIQERDTLVMLTEFNSTSYFVHRGEPQGFEYDYLRAFADEHDLHLATRVVRNRDSLFVLLNQGVGDVIAARLTPTHEDSVRVALTQPLYRTAPALVQRDQPLDSADVPQAVDTLVDSAASAPAPPPLQDSVELRARLISRPGQLEGEEVHTLDETRIEDRLVELSDDVTGDIVVVEVDSGSAEWLMREVAEENINFTVAHENVAELQESHYTNLAVLPTVDQPYAVSWAVRENAPALRQELDTWIDENPGLEQNLYDKYYVDRRAYQERVADEYLSSETGRLSEYDSLFKQHAPGLDWDWRLLASQAYQESKFQPRARSWAGAMGLLQLMPATARQYGVSQPYDPQANVAGAVRFLEWLTDYWEDEIPDGQERLRFILASYNTGHGHVEDARRLTEKNDGDPTVWQDVAYWLLRKSERSVYTDPVVKYGFCRGLEPVTYVSRILDRFDHYRQFVEPGEATQVAADEALPEAAASR